VAALLVQDHLQLFGLNTTGQHLVAKVNSEVGSQ
jgi:hypothetical protein